MVKTRIRKPKKIPLRNLAPVCFEHIRTKWSKQDKREIRLIKNKYGFKKNFSLIAHLAQLPTQAATILEGIRQNPSVNERHQFVDAISRAAHELNNLMKAALTLEGLMEEGGSIIISQIARNTQGEYKTIQQIRDHDLPHFIQECGQLNLSDLIQGCEKTKQTLPPVKAGRHREPFKIAIIQHLVAIYTAGTGKEPTCNQDRPNAAHTGECYEFLADLNCSILKSLDKQFDKENTIAECIYFDKESTVGQYLHEQLQYRNERLLEGYSILVCCLLIKPDDFLLIRHILIQLEIAFLILRRHPHFA